MSVCNRHVFYLCLLDRICRCVFAFMSVCVITNGCVFKCLLIYLCHNIYVLYVFVYVLKKFVRVFG